MARDAFPERNGCGFTFMTVVTARIPNLNLFNSSRIDAINITEVRDKSEGNNATLKAIGLLMSIRTTRVVGMSRSAHPYPTRCANAADFTASRFMRRYR